MAGLLGDAWVGWEEVVGTSWWPFKVEEKDLEGKWAIVTGGNLGIGFELSRMLIKRGCSVIIASRPGKPGDDKEKKVVHELTAGGLRPGQEVKYGATDAEKLESVKDLADRWLATGRPLDFLVGNHGIALPDLAMTDEGFERTYVVNFLSHAYLSLLLLPALAKADRPRIISTGSCFHYFGRQIDWSKINSLDAERWWVPPFLMKYGRAKLLVAIFNRELAIRLGSSDKYRHIITQTVHPGVIATRLFTDLYSWSHPFRTISAFSFGSAGISTVNGANALLKAVVSDDHERAVKGGQYFNRAWPRQPRPEVDDPEARRKVWQMVLEQTGLKEDVIAK